MLNKACFKYCGSELNFELKCFCSASAFVIFWVCNINENAQSALDSRHFDKQLQLQLRLHYLTDGVNNCFSMFTNNLRNMRMLAQPCNSYVLARPYRLVMHRTTFTASLLFCEFYSISRGKIFYVLHIPIFTLHMELTNFMLNLEVRRYANFRHLPNSL